jgi:hypothetical protein
MPLLLQYQLLLLLYLHKYLLLGPPLLEKDLVQMPMVQKQKR